MYLHSIHFGLLLGDRDFVEQAKQVSATHTRWKSHHAIAALSYARFCAVSTSFEQDTFSTNQMATSPDTAAGSPWPNTTPSDNSASPMTAKGVLEWVVYYVEESLHDSVFPEEYGQDYSLTDVAMFYPDRLEKEGLKTPAFLGLDLQTSLAGAIYDARTFEQAHNVTEGLEAPDQKELKAEVETMMDAELQKFGIDLQAKQLDFLSKVNILGTRIILPRF